ncbi:MAG: hypothetical protein ACOYMR_14900 [Ilumatobacteraceae bacterium]
MDRPVRPQAIAWVVLDTVVRALVLLGCVAGAWLALGAVGPTNAAWLTLFVAYGVWQVAVVVVVHPGAWGLRRWSPARAAAIMAALALCRVVWAAPLLVWSLDGRTNLPLAVLSLAVIGVTALVAFGTLGSITRSNSSAAAAPIA